MEKWTEIRFRHEREGVSKREILRDTGMHWTTLEKILEHNEPPGYRMSQPRPKPKREVVLQIPFPQLTDASCVPKCGNVCSRLLSACLNIGKAPFVYGTASGSPRGKSVGRPTSPVRQLSRSSDVPWIGCERLMRSLNQDIETGPFRSENTRNDTEGEKECEISADLLDSGDLTRLGYPTSNDSSGNLREQALERRWGRKRT